MASVVAPSRSRGYVDRRWIEVGLWVAMGLGLALCYIGQTPLLMSAGLLLLGASALLRPDLALLLVPLTAPLFLTTLAVPRSGRHVALPPHELALLVSAAAALPHLLAHSIRFLSTGYRKSVPSSTEDGRPGTATIRLPSPVFRPEKGGMLLRFYALSRTSNEVPQSSTSFNRLGHLATRYAPETLLLIGGLSGLWMAVPDPQARADALRAFRWFVAEPLIFVALIRLHARWPAPGTPAHPLIQARRLLYLFVLSGAGVALVGLFQFAGYLLHMPIAPELYAAGGGVLGSIQRVTSVYGNPNNMALYLGRVWLPAAVLAFTKNQRSGEAEKRRSGEQRVWQLFFFLCSLVCLAAIVISLSRGAWLGAGAALIVLLLPAARQRFGRRRWPIALIVAAITVAVGTLIFALRGGPLGGSADVRIRFWQESIKLLELRPLGVGLDQFLYYHDPAYGRSLIDLALAGANERDARQPHNLLFEIWLNLGPLGIIAFGWLLARCLRRAHATLLLASPSADAALLTRAVIAALVAALVHGMVDSFYFWPDIAIAFWLLIGVSELLGADKHNEPLTR